MASLIALCAALLVGVTGCFVKPDPPRGSGTDDASIGDGAVDATPCTWSAWGPPIPLTPLNAIGSDFAPSLTKDEDRIVWNRSGMLMEAHRETDGWSMPTITLLSGFGGAPLLSGDGLTLWYHRSNPAPAYSDIMMTTRLTVNDPWGASVAVPPFNTNTHERDLEISWNGLDAVLFVGEDANAEQEDIAIASRTSPTGSFGPWARIPTASRVDTYDCCPGISPDGLEVLWETDAIWMARRPDRNSDFGPAEEVPGLSDPLAMYGDPHFNATGTRLYYAARIRSLSPPNYDLFFVERTCAP